VRLSIRRALLPRPGRLSEGPRGWWAGVPRPPTAVPGARQHPLARSRTGAGGDPVGWHSPVPRRRGVGTFSSSCPSDTGFYCIFFQPQSQTEPPCPAWPPTWFPFCFTRYFVQCL